MGGEQRDGSENFVKYVVYKVRAKYEVTTIVAVAVGCVVAV